MTHKQDIPEHEALVGMLTIYSVQMVLSIFEKSLAQNHTVHLAIIPYFSTFLVDNMKTIERMTFIDGKPLPFTFCVSPSRFPPCLLSVC